MLVYVILGLILIAIVWLLLQPKQGYESSNTEGSATLNSASDVKIPAVDPALQQTVEELMVRGRKIEAIKLVRDKTGLGLNEAKLYVESRAQSLTVPPTSEVESEVLQAELRDLLAQGQMIQAVKRVREVTGWGLKEAKDYIDLLRRQSEDRD